MIGNDIAAVKIKCSFKKRELPEIPELKAQDHDGLKDMEVVMAGYPHKSIKDKNNMNEERFFLFSMEGAIEHSDEGEHGTIVAHRIYCSPGQDGGPLQTKGG